MEPISSVSIVEYCACGFFIQAFDYGNEVGTDVVLVHGGPKRCVPYPVESLFKIYEDMV